MTNPLAGSIQILTGKQAGSTFSISKSSMTLGRDPANDIVLQDETISRRHARIFYDGSQWCIENLTQQNIVSVQQRTVQRATILDHETIGLGRDVSFLFLTSAVAQPPVQLPAQPSVQLPVQQPSPVLAATSLQPAATVRAPTSATGASAPSFEISTNTSQDKQRYPLTKQVMNIGRDPSNDIVIGAPVVSAFHIQLVRNGNELVLVHPHPQARGQRTLNGLLYRGRHIRGDEQFRKTLARGDIFRIGDENGTLVTLTFDDGSGAVQEIVPEIRPIQLGAPLITIGRLAQNTVVLSHPQVSGRHARLEQVQGGYRILDLGSTNHVYVNGQLVTNRLLQVGDEIRIGPYRLTYTGTQLTQYDESHSIRIDALNLRRTGNKGVLLLHDISIAIPPRKFVAIVGGSGAGKTTLMDALSGLRPAQQGKVYYNGQDYYSSLAAFSTQLGYVPQDDIVHRDLTVERALYYAARLRLPDDFTEEQIKQRIDAVLDDVEIKRRRKLLVSKLSGGQRKRVSIALELLANPSVFFLDEPTSGLDPGLDRKMMFLLRKLADKGHTILLVTHATNNINACDYVCFLSQGGNLAYFGPPNEAKAFFNKSDFAEIYGDLEPSDDKPNIPAEAEARFKSSSDYQKYVVGPLRQGPAAASAGASNGIPRQVQQPKRGDPWKQFVLLSMRYIELLKNDVGNMLILLLQAPVISLILLILIRAQIGAGVFNATSIVQCPTTQAILSPVGYPEIPNPRSNPQVSIDCQRVVNFLNSDPRGIQYANSRGGEQQALQDFISPTAGGDAQKLLFIMAFAAIMFGCINSAREIVKEANIYRRERAVNLGLSPYMFSKIIVLGVLCLLQSAVLVLTVNAVAPLHDGVIFPAVVEVYITIALTALAGLMIGLAISAIVPNNDRATSFIPIILIPQVIFAGTIFSLNSASLEILGALFPSHWAMAALGSTVGLHGDKLFGDKLLGGSYAYESVIYSSTGRGEVAAHLFYCWLALIMMIVLLGWATTYFLKRKDVRK